MKGSTRKYVDRKYLLCSTKFVLMKKCCQYIYIYIYIYIYNIYIYIYILLRCEYNKIKIFIFTSRLLFLFDYNSYYIYIYIYTKSIDRHLYIDMYLNIHDFIEVHTSAHRGKHTPYIYIYIYI